MSKIDKNNAPKGDIAKLATGGSCRGCKYDGTLGKLCLGGKPSGFFCTAGFRPDRCKVIYVDKPKPKPTLEQQLEIALREVQRVSKAYKKAWGKYVKITAEINAKKQGKKTA